MIDEIRVRRCFKCLETKEVNSDNFHRNKNRPLGFEYKCKVCEHKRTNKHHKSWDKYTPEQRKTKYKNARKHYPEYYKRYKHLTIKSVYKIADKEKGRENDLTDLFIKNALKSPCFYCGYPSTGLDRIDNNIGHTINNCVPCCLECNHARNDNFSHEEMKILGETIRIIKNKRVHFIAGTSFLKLNTP